MLRRILGAAGAAIVIASLTATAALGGEITGNGTSLKVDESKWGTGLHARSVCAFSGQEDLQFLDEEGMPLQVTHKGVPGHAQSWGQMPKDMREFLATVGAHPGTACNPIKTSGEPE